MMLQQHFNFPRGDQLGLLKDLCLPDAPGIKGATAKAVLRAIDDVGVRCYASAATLAMHTNLGLRTVKRAIVRLEELGFVIPDERKHKNPNGSVTLTRLIDWNEIARVVQNQRSTSSPIVDSRLSTSSQIESDATSARNRVNPRTRSSGRFGCIQIGKHGATVAPLPIEHGAMVSDHGATVSDHGATVSDHGATVAPNPQYTQGTATTRNAREAAADSFSCLDWNAVLDRFERLKPKLDRGAAAVRSARENGLTPEQVLAIIDEYELHQSRFTSPGAIIERIRSGSWCAKIPTAIEKSIVEEKKQAKLQAKLREKLYFELNRQWRTAGIWMTKSAAEINSEVDRRLAWIISQQQKPSVAAETTTDGQQRGTR